MTSFENMPFAKLARALYDHSAYLTILLNSGAPTLNDTAEKSWNREVFTVAVSFIQYHPFIINLINTEKYI
jgi:hypothetical protein